VGIMPPKLRCPGVADGACSPRGTLIITLSLLQLAWQLSQQVQPSLHWHSSEQQSFLLLHETVSRAQTAKVIKRRIVFILHLLV
jgi:hypothetical protein